MTRIRSALIADLRVALLALLLLVAWEVSGGDLVLIRLVGGPQGFPLRDGFLVSHLLHDGGRWLAGIVLTLQVLDLARPIVAGPSRRERGMALGLTLAGLLLVPALKRFSVTSCPWDTLEFGGVAAYVPHWLPGVADGGPGHCFPSGHAVSAFAFFSLYFLWRAHRPGWARGALYAVLAFGAMFGAAQMVRGAHYVSHTLWSAWFCWTLTLVLAAAGLRGQPVRSPSLRRTGCSGLRNS
ncbi:MAG: hypothetical protein RIS35_101 [Pseudomonadota bacterium]|jgi:membrane-associated PAP2 superfamily phosphatase